MAVTAGTGDEQLVAAVRRGDDRAFEELYARYQRRIAGYVYGMVNDHGRAEDLTQEIFVSALRRMRATERPIAFKPWIYEIARNACIDQYRRSRRAEEVSFDADDAAGTLDARLTADETPDAVYDAKQRIDDLCGAFGNLSDSHHEILVMRELEGRSYSEIGERLGISRPSVESTLFRARRRLTEEYEEIVSGERCRRVGEMLASGADSLSGREERRLARHIAHCQPCRRRAYAAGVDTVTLARPARRAAARVAALVPVPAFLRLRGGNAAQLSNAAAAVAEPAAGWTKAVVAAALLLAGGAGVAGHEDGPKPSPAVREAAPAQVAPPAPARSERSLGVRRQAPPAARPAASRPEGSSRATAASSPDSAQSEAERTTGAGADPAAAPAPAPAAPSAASVPADQGRSQVPVVKVDPSPPAEDAPRSEPAVTVPQSPQQAYRQVTSTVTMVDGNAGAAVQAAGRGTGLGG